MQLLKRTFLLFVAICSLAGALVAQESYYSSIDGVKGGEALKTALYDLVKVHDRIDYGSGSTSTWGAFYSTDRDPATNKVYDMYSSEVRYFGSKGETISGMNIEHSVAKSWWGGTKNDAYCDLHHLNPSDQSANSRKSNFPMAELDSVSWDNGVTFVGKATIDGSSVSAYEPCDEYKGDFARTFMYMFTCYQNLTYKYTWMNYESSTYPTFKPWAVALLLKWNKQDPVSEKEIARNNAVYAIQGNRNPYIDYPQLAEYVWGDSVDYTFNLSGAITGGGDDTGGDDTENGGTVGNDGKFEFENFHLVKDVADLTPGDSIIMVYNTFAMGAQSGNYRASLDGVVVTGDSITSYPEGTQILLLEEGAVEGSYAFKADSLYLAAVSSSSNYLRSLAMDAVTEAASWVITLGNENVAVIESQGSYTRNKLQYNTSFPRFSCYTGTEKNIKIYAKSPKTIAVDTLRGDVNNDGSVDVADITLIVSMILNVMPATEQADIDGNGTVDVADLTTLVAIILGTDEQ